MINGMYISTMGAMTQVSRHATIANNLANANTDGFKPDWTRMRAIPTESLMHAGRVGVDKILEQTGGGAWLEQTATNFRPGPLRPTGNPLDIALQDSDGMTSFFMVRPDGGEGDIRYTRDGHFLRNSKGMLTTTSGALVVSRDGDTIQLPENGEIKINLDGTIVNYVNGANAVVGAIGVIQTANREEMTKIGENLYSAGENAGLEQFAGGLLSGHLESSATEPILEMAAMIEAFRAYESNMKFLTIQDDTLGQTVRRVGSVA